MTNTKTPERAAKEVDSLKKHEADLKVKLTAQDLLDMDGLSDEDTKLFFLRKKKEQGLGE
jgi:hypothetical protein